MNNKKIKIQSFYEEHINGMSIYIHFNLGINMGYKYLNQYDYPRIKESKIKDILL